MTFQNPFAVLIKDEDITNQLSNALDDFEKFSINIRDGDHIYQKH